MKVLTAAAAAFVLAGAASAADPCAQTRSANVTLPDERTLIVTATAIPGPVAPEGGGDNCRLATAVLTIHTSEGISVSTYAAPVIAASYDLGHTEAEVTAAQLGAFLDEWIKVDIASSDTAPAMDAEGVTTTLSKEDFEAIKASKAPMVCFKESAFVTSCLAPDSIGFIIPFFEREEV